MIAEPKNPHPDLHNMGALLGAVCSLLALMVCIYSCVYVCVCVRVNCAVVTLIDFDAFEKT